MSTIALVDMRPGYGQPRAYCADCTYPHGRFADREQARRHVVDTGHTVHYDVAHRTTYTPRAVR